MTDTRSTAYRMFIEVQQEFSEAVRANDLETAQLAYGEIEAIWMHTDWPRLRAASATFLDRNAAHADELSRFAI